jgi:hypothetical protein
MPRIFRLAASNLAATLNTIESEYTALPVSMMAGVIRSQFAEMRTALTGHPRSLEMLEEEARDLRYWFERLKAMEHDPMLRAYIGQLEREVLWQSPPG